MYPACQVDMTKSSIASFNDRNINIPVGDMTRLSGDAINEICDDECESRIQVQGLGVCDRHLPEERWGDIPGFAYARVLPPVGLRFLTLASQFHDSEGNPFTCYPSCHGCASRLTARGIREEECRHSEEEREIAVRSFFCSEMPST